MFNYQTIIAFITPFPTMEHRSRCFWFEKFCHRTSI